MENKSDADAENYLEEAKTLIVGKNWSELDDLFSKMNEQGYDDLEDSIKEKDMTKEELAEYHNFVHENLDCGHDLTDTL